MHVGLLWKEGTNPVIWIFSI